jgi:hypothetical protein
MKESLKRAFKKATAPVAIPIAASVDERLRPFLERRMEHLEDRFSWVEDRLREARSEVGAVDQRLDTLEGRITTDTQTTAELTAAWQRAAERLVAELNLVRGLLTSGADPHFVGLLGRATSGTDPAADHELGDLLRTVAPGAAERVVAGEEGVVLADLRQGVADFLNWSSGHTGPAGQGGLWLNPPVTVRHTAGAVEPGDVNERIVEVPFAFAAVAGLPAGSAVLDFGAAESTLSFSLASLGFDVTAVDLRPYPLDHPNLRTVTTPVESWEGPDRPLDAILSVSTLEHVGLGHYGHDAGGGDLDRRIIERFAGWLAPGGQLVLTAPYGAWSVDGLQRTYDAEHLDALLTGWQVLERAVCVQTGPTCWQRADGEPPASTWDGGTRGVVLVRATPSVA